MADHTGTHAATVREALSAVAGPNALQLRRTIVGGGAASTGVWS